MLPEVTFPGGLRARRIVVARVDLPEPLSPTTPRISLSPTAKESLSRATSPENLFETDETSSRFSVLPPRSRSSAELAMRGFLPRLASSP